MPEKIAVSTLQLREKPGFCVSVCSAGKSAVASRADEPEKKQKETFTRVKRREDIHHAGAIMSSNKAYFKFCMFLGLVALRADREADSELNTFVLRCTTATLLCFDSCESKTWLFIYIA